MDILDETYRRLSVTGPEFGGGLSNHGPMAAEALCALGRPEAVESWVSAYIRKLEDAPHGANPVDDANWHEALGDSRRVADWERLLANDLTEADWRTVLRRWWPRLVPGISAGATHGVIRTAHAVRALALVETTDRVAELARGLAYWAARYAALPGHPQPRGRLGLRQALDAIPAIETSPDGLLSARLAGLNQVPRFADAVNDLEPPGDIMSGLDQLTATSARLYLRRGHAHPIPYIHGVTAPAAVRLVLPYLPPDLWRPSFNAIWQTVAGLHAAYRIGPERQAPVIEVRTETSLVDAALATGDEHAIKFTEACLRQHEILPQPVFLNSAADAIERLG